MLNKIRRLFGFRAKRATLEKKLFQSVLMHGEPKDYFKWHSFK